MRTGLHAVPAPAQGASERMRRITVIVKNKIGMAVARQPAGDFAALLTDGCAYGSFGAGAVIPGRGSGNVALVLQSFAKLGVAAADVLSQSVAAGGFVL